MEDTGIHFTTMMIELTFDNGIIYTLAIKGEKVPTLGKLRADFRTRKVSTYDTITIDFSKVTMFKILN